ncbi:hypothetical protein MBOE_61000 [Mycolicibacterium boenickei]|uniref:Uncharacterized protein n=1 Tax=Mycolicibacterium boenickei TaxID=146017 RepID=A0ABM7J5D7_9MYCO|nr:hypothetical protein MBOE_61000 [Mycolicibacterium boenickei]
MTGNIVDAGPRAAVAPEVTYTAIMPIIATTSTSGSNLVSRPAGVWRGNAGGASITNSPVGGSPAGRPRVACGVRMVSIDIWTHTEPLGFPLRTEILVRPDPCPVG